MPNGAAAEAVANAARGRFHSLVIDGMALATADVHPVEDDHAGRRSDYELLVVSERATVDRSADVSSAGARPASFFP
jgi:hypothetical protein